jgi:CRP/FNR family transcriptional regulator, cyclic AMP receptor protein
MLMSQKPVPKSPEASFDPKDFLAKIGEGRTISNYRKNEKVFSQGGAADSVFYIQKGKVKVTVVSEHGKEAVVAILGSDEFCGEGCLYFRPWRSVGRTPRRKASVHRRHKAPRGGSNYLGCRMGRPAPGRAPPVPAID